MRASTCRARSCARFHVRAVRRRRNRSSALRRAGVETIAAICSRDAAGGRWPWASAPLCTASTTGRPARRHRLADRIDEVRAVGVQGGGNLVHAQREPESGHQDNRCRVLSRCEALEEPAAGASQTPSRSGMPRDRCVGLRRIASGGRSRASPLNGESSCASGGRETVLAAARDGSEREGVCQGAGFDGSARIVSSRRSAPSSSSTDCRLRRRSSGATSRSMCCGRSMCFLNCVPVRRERGALMRVTGLTTNLPVADMEEAPASTTTTSD